jgi:hypothetical protein
MEVGQGPTGGCSAIGGGGETRVAGRGGIQNEYAVINNKVKK